jgi:hypothetical protein
MTLIIQKPTGAKLNLRKTWQPMDADAAAYITAVETADGQALEEKTKIAIDNFVLGCKADGIWSAIKASCILAGARTLTGALVPLVGTAPTNFNFVAGDYNRKTGLVGNGSTKYLNSNRANNADPRDNSHNAVFSSIIPTTGFALLGCDLAVSGANQTLLNTGTLKASFRSRMGTAAESSLNLVVGFAGHTRSSGSLVTFRNARVTESASTSSDVPTSSSLLVFSRGTPGSLSGVSNARLAFYSIGESLDLALLDARVTDLINAFAAAIP